MLKLNRRNILLSITGTCLLLAGCEKKTSSPEDIQADSFVTFLEQSLLNQPTLSTPHLSQEQKQTFGPFADQYKIITDFHDSLNEVMEPLFPQLISLLKQLETLPKIQKNWHSAKTVSTLIKEQIKPELDKAYQDALNAKKDLKQPDHVKKAFDTVFEKCVEKPTILARDLFLTFDQSLNAVERMGAFLEDNQESISFQGIIVRSNNAAIQSELDTLMKEFDSNMALLEKQRILLQKNFSNE